MRKVRMITMVARFGISIALLMSGVLTGCSGGSKHLSRTDLQLAAGDLRTFGFSAQMLVEQCSAQNATSTFCREQAEFLSDKVDDSLSQLSGHGDDADYERKQLEDIGVNLREIVLRVEQGMIRPSDVGDAERLGAISKVLEDGLRK